MIRRHGSNLCCSTVFDYDQQSISDLEAAMWKEEALKKASKLRECSLYRWCVVRRGDMFLCPFIATSNSELKIICWQEIDGCRGEGVAASQQSRANFLLRVIVEGRVGECCCDWLLLWAEFWLLRKDAMGVMTFSTESSFLIIFRLFFLFRYRFPNAF